MFEENINNMRISDRIRYVGVNDLNKQFFENQWPLPSGVSYNSYLVVDEKIALIDTAAAGFKEDFLKNIEVEIGDRPIDYLVVNHMEPDHSALMSDIRNQYPDIQIVTNAKAVPMIAGYQDITDNIMVVKDMDKLNLGSSSLNFFMIPMVHWPETMVTWHEEEKTLFSGDAFGCFKAVDNPLSSEFCDFEDEMIRYYSNIVGKYGTPVQNALKKLKSLDIQRICSTHGPVWQEELSKVVDLYDRMSRYKTKPGVCLVYASMYGNTEKAAMAVKDELDKRGIECAVHNLNEENVSFAYRDVFKYDTIIVGSPTYNGNIFPSIETFMNGIKLRLVRDRKFEAFGSYTWAAASVKLLNAFAKESGLNVVSDGISFAQGYTETKFDVKSLIDSIL